MKLYLPLCQCPSTGLSHFYYPELEIVFDAPKCVNALLWAYPISTVSIPMATDQSEVCQCPSTGLSHFYGTLWKPSIFKASQTHLCR